MKLYQKKEIRALEDAAVAEGVSLEQLMENAGQALAQAVARRIRPLRGCRAAVLCGKGNNGGDGFFCAARLARQGARCAVLLPCGEPESALARRAFGQLPPQVQIIRDEL